MGDKVAVATLDALRHDSPEKVPTHVAPHEASKRRRLERVRLLKRLNVGLGRPFLHTTARMEKDITGIDGEKRTKGTSDEDKDYKKETHPVDGGHLVVLERAPERELAFLGLQRNERTGRVRRLLVHTLNVVRGPCLEKHEDETVGHEVAQGLVLLVRSKEVACPVPVEHVMLHASIDPAASTLRDGKREKRKGIGKQRRLDPRRAEVEKLTRD